MQDNSEDIPWQELDARQPFVISLISAPSIGLSPRWVQYSGASAAACAVALVLVDLATITTHGDQAPWLDHERLVYLAGLDGVDLLARCLDELRQLGFLTIDSCGRFSISLHPPAGYAGPRNLAEADARFVASRTEGDV